MNSIEFGEIRVVEGENPVGILLREDNNGVVLEEYFDEKGERVDVVHQFEGSVTLCEKEDFEYCLEEARKYEPDLTVPIFVKRSSASAEDEQAAKQQRHEYYKKMATHNQMRPWQLFPNPN